MSREKQIEEMAKGMCDCCRKAVTNDTCEETLCCGVIQHAEALYNAGYRKQEWISVDERLPDKEGTYLTYTDKDRMLFDSFCIYPSIGTKFWIGGNGKVTHWMPLPEAPKMKGGAE